MHNFDTPMMKQYREIKEKYPDCLLLYRMGDFYELFFDDAHIGSKVLNITLTGKSNGKNERIPMAGVPYHAVDIYLGKLVKAGYKVAICEQLSPPNKKGLVDRDVVRVVTPGTILDERVLETKDNNHIVSLEVKSGKLTLSFADLSTGFFGIFDREIENLSQVIHDEMVRLSPVECILPEHLYNDPDFLKIISTDKKINIFPFSEWNYFAKKAEQTLKSQFNVLSLESFGIGPDISLSPAAALLGYLQQTQKSSVSHIQRLTHVQEYEHMKLDRATILNLELFSTIREHDTSGSLLAIIDKTNTSMGGRMLKVWMKQPLSEVNKILLRHELVQELVDNSDLRKELITSLEKISDIERILSRLSVKYGNAQDLINMGQTMCEIFRIKETLDIGKSELLSPLMNGISDDLKAINLIINKNISEDAPIDVKNGGMIKQGINKELDKLRKIVGGSRDWIVELEQQERKRTGIQNLKIKSNKVFGYYIEISKSHIQRIPKNYQRMQTLVNGERFTTPDLKHHEKVILTAQDRINELEFAIFNQVLDSILEYTTFVQEAAHAIAVLDCLVCFSKIAIENDYVRPTMTIRGDIKIKSGRHPVVEKLLEVDQFVPNDIELSSSSHHQLLITGPNMAGKSVLLRQVALIILMAQMGSFVPAQHAELSVIDRIFVRSGASDVITAGLSTFMVEMVETAHILHHATDNSLIIMDEIGRGTSTYDGISIAWAVAEYLVSGTNISPKTLFATHYHELQALEKQFPNKIRNFHMSVADENGTPIFLHTLVPGGASHSYGIAVAELAGVPEHVIKRAKEVMANLETRNFDKNTKFVSNEQSSISTDTVKNYDPDILIDKVIHKELEKIDISRMTPLQALNTLADLKDTLAEYTSGIKSRELD